MVRGEHSKGRLTWIDIVQMQLDELMFIMDEPLVWPTGLLFHIAPPDDKGESWMHVFSTSSIPSELNHPSNEHCLKQIVMAPSILDQSMLGNSDWTQLGVVPPP